MSCLQDLIYIRFTKKCSICPGKPAGKCMFWDIMVYSYLKYNFDIEVLDGYSKETTAP